MICYLPFAHIAQNPFQRVAQALGPLTVYSPGPSWVTESMRSMQQRGLLELHTPAGVDDAQILITLAEFKDWAQLHDGHIGDMVQYFSTHQGRPPLVDDTAPSQIRTQIRHFGEDAANSDAGMLMQSALFLALAQEYDQHQERLHNDLAEVTGMEQAMFATLGGDRDGDLPVKNQLTGAGDTPLTEDPGSYMTRQRLQAWARMVRPIDPPPRVYLTPSVAVYDHLKGLMPKPVEQSTWYLNGQEDPPDLKQNRRTVLEALDRMDNIQAVQLDPELCGQPSADAVTLELVGLRGCLLEALLSTQCAPEGCNHALLGLVKPAQSTSP